VKKTSIVLSAATLALIAVANLSADYYNTPAQYTGQQAQYNAQPQQAQPSQSSYNYYNAPVAPPPPPQPAYYGGYQYSQPGAVYSPGILAPPTPEQVNPGAAAADRLYESYKYLPQ
jgi:hypothetical protein